MKIGILQCGHALEEVVAQHGDFTDMFQRLLAGNDFEFETFDVVDMEFPDGIDQVDGWLLTGSRLGVYEDHAFIAPLEKFVRDVYAADIPMVGICFGHQLIAQALGGKVEKFGDGWAIGRQEYTFENEGKVALNAWHQDQVIERPSDARVLAGNDFCENAALVYGKRAFTVQPHPEFSNETLKDYLVEKRDAPGMPVPLIDQALGRTDDATDNALLAKQIAKFFKTRTV